MRWLPAPRFRTRSLLVLAALVAVALVTPGEIRQRRERRHLARIGVCYREHIAAHEEQASLCRANAGRPYISDVRQEAVSKAMRIANLPELPGWDAEADWHDRKSALYREGLTAFEQEERTIRNRLILPVIFDIRSSRR